MPIHANIDQRTARRSFAEPSHRQRPLTVIDRTLPAFRLKVAKNDTRTFFVRVKRRPRAIDLTLGTADELTAAEARAMALAEIEAASAERAAGPLFRDFADEFMRRQCRRWKPATRQSNRSALNNQILPVFGDMRLAHIDRADVARWFDSLSATPGNANRALPVLSVMMTQAELWELRPQGSNPCRNLRRYKMKPRERFLSLDELKRLGFVLDHAEDAQAAAAIRLRPFPHARPRRRPARPRRSPCRTALTAGAGMPGDGDGGQALPGEPYRKSRHVTRSDRFRRPGRHAPLPSDREPARAGRAPGAIVRTARARERLFARHAPGTARGADRWRARGTAAEECGKRVPARPRRRRAADHAVRSPLRRGASHGRAPLRRLRRARRRASPDTR